MFYFIPVRSHKPTEEELSPRMRQDFGPLPWGGIKSRPVRGIARRAAARQSLSSFFVSGEESPASSIRCRACALRRCRFARNAAARRSARRSASVFWLPELAVFWDFTMAGECRERAMNSSQETCLHLRKPCGMFRRALRGAFLAAGFSAARCCRSSGVEHSLGKGEVECSNHSGSTIPSQ